jgi:hypothetical protein
VSWSFVGSVTPVAGTTNFVNNTSTSTVSLPASVQGGDLVVVAWSMSGSGATCTVSIPGFTTVPGSPAAGGAKGSGSFSDQFWVGTHTAGGSAGGATTDTSYTATFNVAAFGECVTYVLRSTLGGWVVIGGGKYNGNSASSYLTACPDAVYTPTSASNATVWGYAGQNAAVGTTATSFTGTATTALSNFAQGGLTANGGGVGIGWIQSTSAPGGATANQAVDATDFAVEVAEQATATGVAPTVPVPVPPGRQSPMAFTLMAPQLATPAVPAVTAPAGLASGTGAVTQAALAQGVLAAGTGTVPPSSLAQAALASGTGTAQPPVVNTVSAGLATGTGTAQPPGLAQAALAAGTGTSQPATVPGLTIANAGLATGAGAALSIPYFAVGALGSATANGFTLTPKQAGDFILLWVTSETSADFATAISNSGNVTWSVLVAHTAFPNNAVVQTVFFGVVNSTAGQAQTITFNTGSPVIRVAWQEFFAAAGTGSLALDASGTTDTLASGTMPPVTPTRTGDLYAGYVFDNGTGSAGSTSGYTYQLDANTNQYAYRLSVPGTSTQTPNIGDANGTSGIGVLIFNSGTIASAGLATGTGTAQPPGLAQAALAAGTGTAQPPSAPGPFLAGLAHGTGTAPPFGLAQAALAAGTGTAQPPGLAQAGLATGAGAASSLTAAPAGLATGTGTAQPGQFFALARLASGTGTASQSPAPAGLASGTGTAFQVPAPAGLAHGTGTALSTSAPNAGLAAGTGAASVFGLAQGALAHGTGTAQPPSAPGPFLAGLAHGAGAASALSLAQAGLAHGTGTAGLPPFPTPLNHFAVAFTEPGPSAALTENSFGGTLTVPSFGAALTLANLGGSLTPVSPSATCTIPGYGATLSLANLGAVLTGGTMQQATLTLSEFNDMTINIAVTNNGVAFNLTGYNLNLLLKSAAGVPDSSALTFSSSGGSPAITITSPSGGLAVAQLPNVDLDAETYSFYRLDVVNASSQQQTTVYGSIIWITL